MLTRGMSVLPAFKTLILFATSVWLTTIFILFYPYMKQYMLNLKVCATINDFHSQFTRQSRELRFKEQIDPNIQLSSVCANESCRSDYVRHLHATDAYPIPAIRHILWRNESVSEYFALQLRSWQRIHPDWSYVLWRDRDLEPFVAAHFPGFLAKFQSLPRYIMKVDMIRYMLLFKFGGIYADLDYRLVKNLDDFRRYYAVVTREPDVHSLLSYGMTWPVKLMANPAFMMSAPGHIFFHYTMQQLMARDESQHVITFAGPMGLTDIIDKYQSMFQLANNAMETVYVPPTNCFFPYPGNRLKASGSEVTGDRVDQLREKCSSLLPISGRDREPLRENLRQFCQDVSNLDWITDNSQTVFAIHDLTKPSGIWFGSEGRGIYTRDLTDVRTVLKNVILGIDYVSKEKP